MRFLIVAVLLTSPMIPLNVERSHPGKRVDPEMFYHPELRKVVLFDGIPPFLQDAPETQVFSWDGTSWSEEPLSNAPAARYASCAAYDRKRRKIVSFSGRAGRKESVDSDTWEADLAAWTSVPAGSMPARDHHTMCYDESLERVLLFGGGKFPRETGPWATDTWAWDGRTWQQIATDGPLGRVSAMVYDSWRAQIVMFGGVGEPSAGKQPKYADTWILKNGEWKLVSVNGPPPRSRHAMVFDRKRGVILMYGGENDDGDLGDMWEWNGLQWRQIRMIEPNPGKRYVHAMAYDEARDVTVLYGGMNNRELKSDTWEWDGGRWKQIE